MKEKETVNTEKNEVKKDESKIKNEKEPTVTKVTTEKSDEKVENTQENIIKDSGYTETEVQVAPKQECTGNNHKIDSGNTGK